MSWRRKPAVHSRLARLAALVVLASTAAVTPSSAQAPGYVRVKLVKAALVVGVGGGSGVLTYRGRTYPFRESGLSVGFAAGASVSRLEGWASGIRQVSDFAGTYSSVGGGGAFVGGAGGYSSEMKRVSLSRCAVAGPAWSLPKCQPGGDFVEGKMISFVERYRGGGLLGLTGLPAGYRALASADRGDRANRRCGSAAHVVPV